VEQEHGHEHEHEHEHEHTDPVIDTEDMTCNGCIGGVRRTIGKLDEVGAAVGAFPAATAAVKIGVARLTPVRIEQGIEKLAIGVHRRGPSDLIWHTVVCRSHATSYSSHRPEWGRQSAARERSPQEAGGHTMNSTIVNTRS
jgi:copper chaperone CopZ